MTNSKVSSKTCPDCGKNLRSIIYFKDKKKKILLVCDSCKKLIDEVDEEVERNSKEMEGGI